MTVMAKAKKGLLPLKIKGWKCNQYSIKMQEDRRSKAIQVNLIKVLCLDQSQSFLVKPLKRSIGKKL